jgi:hypothetical protein
LFRFYTLTVNDEHDEPAFVIDDDREGKMGEDNIPMRDLYEHAQRIQRTKRLLYATTTKCVHFMVMIIYCISRYSRLEKKMTYATVMFRTVLVK